MTPALQAETDPDYGMLVFLRESWSSEFGIALYEYTRWQRLQDFPAVNNEGEAEAYRQMEDFAETWELEFVDY